MRLVPVCTSTWVAPRSLVKTQVCTRSGRAASHLVNVRRGALHVELVDAPPVVRDLARHLEGRNGKVEGSAGARLWQNGVTRLRTWNTLVPLAAHVPYAQRQKAIVQYLLPCACPRQACLCCNPATPRTGTSQSAVTLLVVSCPVPQDLPCPAPATVGP